MDKGILESYSSWAKENLEKQIEISLKTLGIDGESDIKKAKKVGDYTIIDGDSTSYPADLFYKRNDIIKLVENQGYKNVIEEFAYTWFNRFVALRFMEVHDYLPHGFRVLSSRDDGIEPEILKNIGLVKDELKLDIEQCANLREQGKVEELFRYILFRQCNALSDILPMLFSNENSYLELLLPKTLLKGETVITRMLEIPEEDFLNEIEIIGWLYQFYNSAKKKAVNASKKTITKDTLPAVTQLFTPDWIVRYMAENSVGRIWLESYPSSSLGGEMKYYIDDPEQPEEVQRKLDAIKYKNVNPKDIKIIEPCCGSGHILVYVFDLLIKMYEEKGYQKRDIPTMILSKNLTGLDVDKRAAQLSSFSLIMKAREINSRFFSDAYYVVPRVYEISDSMTLFHMNYAKQIEDLQVLNEEERRAIQYLVESFRYGKTIGSLLKLLPERFADAQKAILAIENNAVSSVFNLDFLSVGVKKIKEILKVATILTTKYDVMITNPPYIGSSAMEQHVKDYANTIYPNSKADMFSMFMDVGLVNHNGFLAMINMHSWMFLSGYENFRKSLANRTTINMLHLGAHAFEEINGEVVQTTAFIMKNTELQGYLCTYFRLTEENSQTKKENAFFERKSIYLVSARCFETIPLYRQIYWIKNTNVWASNHIDSKYISGGRNKTHNNEKYVRSWWEVTGVLTKWAFYMNGGNARKWYGNITDVVMWSPEAKREYASHGGLVDEINVMKEGISWNGIAGKMPSFRLKPSSVVYSSSSPTIIPIGKDNPAYVMGLLNSKPGKNILNALNPTLQLNVGEVLEFPYEMIENGDEVIGKCEINIKLAKEDWDSYETSWDFHMHPLFISPSERREQYGAGIHSNERSEYVSNLDRIFERWEQACQYRFDTLKANEEEINHYFINLYDLQNELSPEVEDNDVTVRLANRDRDIRSLISYLVGIVMGRYSPDGTGLAYAGGKWDSSRYITYQPDDDGVVPIYSTIGMSDGLTGKIIELIKLIYGKDTYRPNIDFIAEALGKMSNESSEETLNRYLNDGFYSDHLKVYQKRPIYWMFSSGKNSGFKCLIYMHRYSPDMLAAINGKYFLPESTRLKSELEELNLSITSAEGREKIRLEKERQKMAAAYNEAIEYGQVLDHMANKYIEIDLDDGVKVNYAKFQDVEIVTDAGTKVKKDLLVPIK